MKLAPLCHSFFAEKFYKMSLNEGPDQIIPSEDFVTMSPEGSVKLRIGDTVPANYDPVSVPGLLMQAAKEAPNHTALSIKRNGEWIKWTYSQYLKGTLLCRLFSPLM